MNSFYGSPFDQQDLKITGKVKTWYVVIFIVVGVVITVWGGLVGKELSEKNRALATEHPVQLGAWIGYTGNGEFARDKELTLERVKLYYVTEQGKQAEYYEYCRVDDTCRLCAYIVERYDEKGNCIYRVSESEDSGGMIQEYFLYQYDLDDKMVQKVSYRGDVIVQIVDFCYPDEGVTASVVQNYQDGVLLPEVSYGLVADQEGRELLRMRLDTHEPVEETKEIDSAVYSWQILDQSGRIQYLLELDPAQDGQMNAYLTRYEYNTKGFISAEYLYSWLLDSVNGSLELQDDVFIVFDGAELRTILQGD